MSKIIELTVQLDVNRVSCPGVWLCQDGYVMLTVHALGTSYQTCLLPPIFPIMFKDVFYFKKRFQENCALNNICCLLKDETIYCELIQWTEDCVSSKYVILAQYLGNLNDVLFPPNMCATDGVDLLMRRSRHFPGILSPKIEIATKVRIDEVWSHQPAPTLNTCKCLPDKYEEPVKQSKVCHTPRYHRHRCDASVNDWRPRPRPNSKSRSFCNDRRKLSPDPVCCRGRSPSPRSHSCTRTHSHGRGNSYVYNVQTSHQSSILGNNKSKNMTEDDTLRNSSNDYMTESSELDVPYLNDDKLRRTVLESNHINFNKCDDKYSDKYKKIYKSPPCVCEICKRYHQLFHQIV